MDNQNEQIMKRKSLLGVWLLIGYLSIIHVAAFAQGWEKSYSPDRKMNPTSLFQKADQSFMMSGINFDDRTQFRLMKLAADGSIIWVNDYDSLSFSSWGIVTQDDGYLAAGYAAYDSSNSPNDTKRALIKIDAAGNKQWLKFVPSFSNWRNQGGVGNMALDTTDNGGYIFTFNTFDSAAVTSASNKIIRRLDSSGDTIWSHTYFDGDTSFYIYYIKNMKDGGFLVGLGGGNAGNGGNRLFKIDSAGAMLWQYIAPYAGASMGGKLANDGNILVYGTYYPNGFGYAPASFVGKIDQNGNQLWLKDFTGITDTVGMGGLIENNDNTYSLVGGRYTSNPVFYYFKTDTLGHILRQQRIPVNFQGGYLYSGAFIPTADQGYLLGLYLSAALNNYSVALVKMDSNGVVYPHLLSGSLFFDNNNCLRDSGEALLRQSTLTFTSAPDTFTVATNDSGFYSIGLNSSTYQLDVNPSLHYSAPSSCDPTQVTITGIDSTIDLGFTPTVNFPYVTVDGQTRQRPCVPLNYTAQYCNTGTAPFTGIISITFDSIAMVDSASIPWIFPHTGNTYQFHIDTLGVMDCASFVIHYHLPCDPDLIGHTLCIDADVQADTVTNPSSNWDQSNLVMTAHCNTATDSVEFTLKNMGTGTTINPPQLIVIEDNVISARHIGQLAPGAVHTEVVKANGSTWRATAQQTPNNPYSSFTTAAIEGCGTNQQGGISLHYYMQYPYNNYYAFHYSTCTEVVNSVDPNHKSVSPTGTGTDHLIDSTTPLEYTIEFQNTGTDTAYMVRVIDTLADYLDAATIKPGASSHPYTMELSDNHILTFLFHNIYLPDSGHNQAASNGFVKFRIQQKHSNPTGTVINNDAAIYFDYNQPVITNTATVQVGKVLISGIENLYTQAAVNIQAYPNPFASQAVIKVDGANFAELQLRVFDMAGRTVKLLRAYNTNQFVLDRNGLNNGCYLFEITSQNQAVGKGKIVVE